MEMDSDEDLVNELAMVNNQSCNSSDSKIDNQKEIKKIKHSARKILLEARKGINDDIFLKSITIKINLAMNSFKRNEPPRNDLIFGNP